MVEIYDGFMKGGMDKEQAWRRSFFIPGALSMVSGVAIYLLGTDTPLVSLTHYMACRCCCVVVVAAGAEHGLLAPAAAAAAAHSHARLMSSHQHTNSDDVKLHDTIKTGRHEGP